eukprot:6187613-Pleurochrysis_carterae.AAC.4
MPRAKGEEQVRATLHLAVPRRVVVALVQAEKGGEQQFGGGWGREAEKTGLVGVCHSAHLRLQRAPRQGLGELQRHQQEKAGQS